MKIYSILMAILFAKSVQADICSDNKCPRGRQPTAVCFSDPSIYSGILFKAAATANCGYFTDVVVATNTDKIRETLEKLAKECKSLVRMTLSGHGGDGYQEAGSLDSGSVQDLRAYGCLFNKDATIRYTGCLVGRGCSGDMLFYQTAKSLLPNGGTVTGSTFYNTTFLPGVIPHFSLNGRGRKLIYSPSNRPPDSWQMTGLAISNGGSINDRCANDLKDLLDDLEKAKTSAKKRQCSSSSIDLSDQRLTSYRRMQERLLQPPPYLQTANSDAWYELSNALTSMKVQIRRYESCQPPSKGSDGSGAISEGVK